MHFRCDGMLLELASFRHHRCIGSPPLSAPNLYVCLFKVLYIFVVIQHASRRILHFNVTAHPTADWTLQQLREAIGFNGGYRFLLHDRDRIFANHLDDSVRCLGLDILKSPVHSPNANAICERVIGTIRRECLDWMIPLSQTHLRSILKTWDEHYNKGRPHSFLGPGIPDPPGRLELADRPELRHRLDGNTSVRVKSVLGGLHHEYSLEPLRG